MADSKTTALTELTTFSGDETFYVVEDDDGTPVSRRVTIENLRAGIITGQYIKDRASASRTAGNVTMSSTNWASVDTGIDLVLDAAAGDEIEVSLSSLVDASGTASARFDVVTVVSGSPVSSFAEQGASVTIPGVQGVIGWYCRTGAYQQLAGSANYVLGSGDISGGTVTLRLRYSLTGASNRTLHASTTEPLRWTARNLGPPA